MGTSRVRVLATTAGLLVGVAALCGCAGPQPLPANYTGPTAYVVDSSVRTGNLPQSGTIFFTLAEVDGGGKLQTSVERTRIASSGLGFRQNVVEASWTLKAGPAKLRLLGRVSYGAPIQELFASASGRSIEGTVDVDLKPGNRYIVKGALDAYRSEIWLEDLYSGEIAGEKIVKKADPALLAKSAASGTYTCCNLRYDDKLITDENFLEWPVIPAGARVAVVGFHGSSADVLVEGKPMVFDVYVGNQVKAGKMRPQDLAERYAVAQDPQAKIASYPPDIQRAVRASKVMPGMTREQVLISVGYPWLTKTASLDARRWSYFASHDDDDEYVVVWGDNGTVETIEAPARVRAIVLP